LPLSVTGHITPRAGVRDEIFGSRVRVTEPTRERGPMKPIHWLALVPIVGMLIGPIVHNEVRPLILGMPFPLGWIAIWVVLTAIVMAIIYALDPANRGDSP
jgi:Protein of unknown function (DUF3311)